MRLPRGWSRQKALNMGMPHIPGNRCFVCGSTSCSMGFFSQHHITPKGPGGRDKFMTIVSPELNQYKLESSMAPLCGSGVTGCHATLHGNAVKGSTYSLGWVWDDLAMEVLWWAGELLDQGLEPHTYKLWEFGHYELWENRRIAGVSYKRLYLSVYNGEVVMPEELTDWERS